jgi:hypothetical protein
MDNNESESKFDMDDLNVGDMINSFKGVANNPLSKFILSRTFDYCEKDKGNTLEVVLELYW